MWVRGLKHGKHLQSGMVPRSHPMWVRGLKPGTSAPSRCQMQVAPHVGAWIETRTPRWYQPRQDSRTPCGCVD